MLLEYCGTFGVSEEEVELLLEVGYDPDEIEELLMDTAAMRKQLARQKHCYSVKHKSKRKIGGI